MLYIRFSEYSNSLTYHLFCHLFFLIENICERYEASNTISRPLFGIRCFSSKEKKSGKETICRMQNGFERNKMKLNEIKVTKRIGRWQVNTKKWASESVITEIRSSTNLTNWLEQRTTGLLLFSGLQCAVVVAQRSGVFAGDERERTGWTLPIEDERVARTRILGDGRRGKAGRERANGFDERRERSVRSNWIAMRMMWSSDEIERRDRRSSIRPDDKSKEQTAEVRKSEKTECRWRQNIMIIKSERSRRPDVSRILINLTVYIRRPACRRPDTFWFGEKRADSRELCECERNGKRW